MRFLLVLLMLPTLAFAEQINIDTSGLSPEQVQQIQNIANVGKAENTAKVIRSEVSAWGEMGASFGQALVAVAKEVGVAAADFADTPLGKLVLVVLFIKMFGGPILGVLLGLLVMVLATSLWWYLVKRVITVPKYDTKPVLWGMWQRRFVVGHTEGLRGWEEWSCAILIVGNLIGVAGIVAGACNV